jgi:signal transduction histidine kinase
MRPLAIKLIVAFVVVGLTVAALVAIFAGQITASEFGDFLFNLNQESITDQLGQYYQAHSSWEGVEEALPEIFDPRHGGDPDILLVDADGRVVAGRPPFGPDQTLSQTELAQGMPVEVDGQTVGTLLREHAPFGIPGRTNPFLERVNRALIIAAVGGTALALLMGWLLARALTGQLRELTLATRRIASGDFGLQVKVRSRDEIGHLAESFNSMSTDLARGREIRRQMTADIAHELRTPLSLILGHTEALRDGVLPPTRETHSLLHDEAVRLNRLVEDLRTLSLADAGELSLNRRAVAPGALLERAVAVYAPRLLQQNIALKTEIAPALPSVDVDPDRMAQVLNNLLDNAARHTPAGGNIVCRATVAAVDRAHPSPRVRLSIADSGPGIAPADLPFIFERFYRADKSRQHDSSGSGLGLAIAKSVVEAHGGRIWIESQPGAGAMFLIELPGMPV